jgi:hypothetical protein
MNDPGIPRAFPLAGGRRLMASGPSPVVRASRHRNALGGLAVMRRAGVGIPAAPFVKFNRGKESLSDGREK